ncbi:MAG: rod shape-determining protein [Clostridia bacterium]|nr:rod shape-determining protein [Clostridia bacterium]
MAIFSQDLVAVDMGSSATSVYVDGLGVCLREPTQLVVSKEDIRQVAAIGEDARRMYGILPPDLMFMPPVVDTAVTDTDLAALTMLALAEKAAGRKKPADKGRFMVSAATGLTHVEHAALLAACRLTGSRRITAVNSSIAAAVGAGLDITEPKGVLLVDMGGGATEIAIMSLGAVAASRTIRSGCMNFDKAIIRYMRAKRGISISPISAEEIKKTVGSAILPPEHSTGDVTRVAGRDLKTGKPCEVTVTAREVSGAIRLCIDELISSIQDVLISLPSEFAGDIKKSGIYLSGGCANLSGLSDEISARCDLKCHMTSTPQDDVANGLGVIGSNEALLRELITAGSCVE